MSHAAVDLEDLLGRLRGAAALALNDSELELLLGGTRLLREVDSHMAGPIRVLEHAGAVIIQEQTLEKQPVARQVASIAAADELIDQRLAVYERMWDGCGCKVDYFS